MFAFDSISMLVFLIGLPLVFLPQLWVKNTYKHWKEVPTHRGLTGAEVARSILKNAGITNVVVEETPDELGDHYSPSELTVRLSPFVFQGKSVAAAAIAAHEVGHAIQHHESYAPVVWRGQLAPVVGIASQLGPWLFLGGTLLHFGLHLGGGLASLLSLAGIVLFAVAVLFHLVTLPVELDASGRALRVLEGSTYLYNDEMVGAKKMLTSAAFTYVAAALYALLELVGYIIRYMGMTQQSDEE